MYSWKPCTTYPAFYIIVRIMWLRIVCTQRGYRDSWEHTNNIKFAHATLISVHSIALKVEALFIFPFPLLSIVRSFYTHILPFPRQGFTQRWMSGCLHNSTLKILLLSYKCPGPVYFSSERSCLVTSSCK